LKTLRKTIFAAALIFIISAVFGGCAIPNDNSSEVEKILEFMEETYTDDNFTYVSTTYGDRFMSGYTEIVMTSELYPNEEIMGFYSRPDGKTIIKDNYITIKYREQKKQKLEDLLRELFGDTTFHIFPERETRLLDLNKFDNAPFEEYISSDENKILFIVVADMPYDSINKAEFEQQITDVFRKNNVSMSLYIDFYADDKIAELENSDLNYLGYESELGIEPHSYLRLNCELYNNEKNVFEWKESSYIE
jgi:hypothetical protein